MKTFWPVLGAILAAALIIVAIKMFYNQTEATRVADENFQKEMTRADDIIRVYKNAFASPSPSRNLRKTVTPTPSPSPSLQLPQTVTLTQDVSIQLPKGNVVLRPGTTIQLIARNGANVQIRYMDANYEIPVSATDLKF